MTGRLRLTRRLGRLPLRVRLVAGFSAAMLAVLLGAGAFVYWRVEFALDRGLDAELSQATATIDPTVTAGLDVPDPTAAEGTGTAWQVLTPDGRVVAHGGPAPATPLVGPSQLAQVGGGTLVAELGSILPVSPEPYRLHVTPVPDAAGFLVVGVRRDHRDEALRELLVQLSVAGLAALVITSFVGDRLARAALAPVERYRRRAAEIAQGASGLRLEVPVDRDDEVTRLGTTLNEMLASLEDALEEQERFVHEASHELRTPLTLLQARLQLAARRPRSVEEHEEVLAELGTDVTRLVELAEQLLALGSAGAGRSDLGAPLGIGELTDVVDAVVDRHRGAGPAGREDRVVVDPSIPSEVSVPLSAVVWERVASNLVTNAYLHGAPPVTVTIDGSDAWVRVTVEDVGSGMPAELLATATARFARAPEARSRPGSGLGLALVEALVRAAGGELRLCHGAHHVSFGAPTPVSCRSHAGMTVSVIVPTSPPPLADAMTR